MDAPEPQRLSRLTPLAQVYERMAAIVRAVEPRAVEIAQAAGRVLAADASADGAMPARAVALRDGWAVRSDLVSDASSYAPALLDPAPDFVEIGAPLPPGTDAVLPPDAVILRRGMAEAMAGAAPGDGVLPTGADADTQQPLRRAGQRLRDLDVAILCATKVARVSVREPRVRVISAAPIEAAADVVGPLIAQAVNAAGGAGSLVRTHGDTDALARALQEDDVDAFVTIGGTGEGRRDASVRTLARTGRFELHGMGLRPGETAALGAVDARAALMLPGRLDAALAVWLTAGQYLLRRLTGWQEAQAGHAAKLTRKIVSTIGLVEIVPVAACEGGVEPLASGYFPLQALACAEGWVMVPPESEGYPAGATVEVMPFP